MTEINKLIEQEASKYWSNSSYKEAAEEAHSKDDMCVTSAMARKVSSASFKAGANFILHQNRWRKVEEELPEQDISLLIESGGKTYKGKMEKLGTIKTKPILVKYADGRCVIAHRCQCKGDSYYWWDCHESFDKDDFMYITEWKPIE